MPCPTVINECTRLPASSSSCSSARSSSRVMCLSGSRRAPMRRNAFFCTTRPLPLVSSKRTVFVIAQTKRWPRRPCTQWPPQSRRRCCAQTRAGTGRNLVFSSSRSSSRKPPIPIGNSSGCERSRRPTEPTTDGSSLILCQPKTAFEDECGVTPARCSAAMRTPSSASGPSGAPSSAPLPWRPAVRSCTIRSSSRRYSVSSARLSKSESLPKRPPTTSLHHRARPLTVTSPSSNHSRRPMSSFKLQKNPAGVSASVVFQTCSTSPSQATSSAVHQASRCAAKSKSLKMSHSLNTSTSTTSCPAPLNSA